MRNYSKGLVLALLSSFSVQSSAAVFNNPYPKEDSLKKIYYTSFNEQPKTLDPAHSYSANEYQFIMQIYEPLLEYDYYARPYQLKPLTTKAMPSVRFLNKDFQAVSSPSEEVAFSVYTIHLKPGIFYQPHPAFAQDEKGEYRYLQLADYYVSEKGMQRLSDFRYTGTRELVADDYIYEIKRLASPNVSSPIYGLMSDYIVGFHEFGQSLPTRVQSKFINLNRYPLSGLHKIDDYTFEITIKGLYPQFLFWLAMPFFAPIPWEVDKFYSQPGMNEKNLTFDWYPVGTGAFMLAENNPNRHMILVRNPNFREEWFPQGGNAADQQAGYGHGGNQRLPLIEKAVYTLEQESIPRWNKFLQGYYDLSGISNDSFNQAIQLNEKGVPILSKSMQEKKMRLTRTNDPSIYYLGFNMLDPIIGGQSERARKLRLAISIALDYEENINLFFNGRGLIAHGPIPQGIFGFKEGQAGINNYVYDWKNNSPVRRSLQEAQQLMREAGYPEGRDPKTGKALILHYDITVSGGPDDKSALDWMRKQFAKLGIDLDVRATLYNRFQDKMRSGNAQIFSWGWNADYPDPENFLFLLYGPNGKVKHGGENAANYANPQFDILFEQMKNRPNDEGRIRLIEAMLEILRRDAPWVWGINTETLILSQQWVAPNKPNTISLNQLKYMSIDSQLRTHLRREWNQAILWPLVFLVLLLACGFMPLFWMYSRREKSKAGRLSE